MALARAATAGLRVSSALTAGLLVSLVLWSTAAALHAQSPPKTGARSSFTRSDAQLLLLFVDKQEEAFGAAITQVARGWSIFKDLKPAAGAPRTYVLVAAAPTTDSNADPASFIETLRPYVAATPGNLLKADAELAMTRPRGAADGLSTPSDPASDSPASDWTFNGDVGLILFFVRPANRPQFEGILSVTTAGLGEDSKVFRVGDLTPNGLQIYALLISPVEHGTSYAFGPILGRALSGTALQQAYADYAGSVSAANVFDLKRVVAGN
jgi:hypothetical protein